ncbi:MAG: carbohydrate ABC transporter permease [Propionibacteriaceae bacterium]|jgi:N,N'-diacetylchitobiose transport system permease protein|nr:carbohydrate ABC transporter permease [Propionibacteriaceae bacterium]
MSTTVRTTSTAERTAAPRRNRRKTVATVVYSTTAVVVGLIMAFPVYWMVNTSFLPPTMIRGAVPNFFAGSDATLQNYERAIFGEGRAPFLPALTNSLLTSLITVVGAILIGFLAALAVSRFKFFGRHTFIIAILIVQMLPGAALLWTYYQIIDGWGLTNNIIGLSLLLICASLPFTIWTMRGFVLTVPPDLEESAMVDGCTRAGAFWRITFPLLAPGLVSTGIFSFITSWNTFTLALVIMNRPESMTLPVWLRTFQQLNRGTDWGALMAGSTLVALPVMIFFLIVQSRMTGGLVAGAVKG